MSRPENYELLKVYIVTLTKGVKNAKDLLPCMAHRVRIPDSQQYRPGGGPSKQTINIACQGRSALSELCLRVLVGPRMQAAWPEGCHQGYLVA